MKEQTEYDELRAAGLTDHQIKMLCNAGATHAAMLLWASETEWARGGTR